MEKTEVTLAKKAIFDAGLYIASKEDISRLSEVSADAFENYPLHMWFCKEKYNKKTIKLLIESSLKSMDENCIIYADSPEMNGFAVWCLGFTGIKTISFLAHGGVKMFFHGGFPLIKKLLDYEALAMKLKEKYTTSADWYLYNLTVASHAQRKGIGKKLLQPMLDFCDRNNKSAYLETNKNANVSIYEKFGFELKEKCSLLGSDYMHYAMMRTPKETNNKI